MAISKQNKDLASKVITYGIGAGLTYFLVVKPILSKLGIIKDTKQISIENATINPLSPFNPNYWKSTNSSMILTDVALNDIINFIADSFGIFSDNYAGILGQFKKLSYKSQVSYLADKWQQKKGTDLINFLSNGGGIFLWDGLSKEHLAELIAYTNNLK